MSVQVFVIQNAFSEAEYPTSLLLVLDSLRKITAALERIGIWFYAAKAPENTAITIGTDIKYDVVPLLLPTTGPDAVANPQLLLDPDLARIAARHAPIGMQARLFFIKTILVRDGDKPDPISPPGLTYTFHPNPVLNFTSWVSSAIPTTHAWLPYAAAHELGHCLTYVSPPAKGHYSRPAVPFPNRLVESRNLMAAVHPAVGENTRLWDAPDGSNCNQYVQMRACPLTGPLT